MLTDETLQGTGLARRLGGENRHKLSDGLAGLRKHHLLTRGDLVEESGKVSLGLVGIYDFRHLSKVD